MISLGGYTQARYYRLLETNPNLGCEQCYKSCGADNGWFLRRGRLRFSGYVTKRIFLYIQPDFASGRGPGYNPALNTSEESNLNGGNVLAHLWDKIKGHALAPFVWYQYFNGGKKHELDARSYEVSDLEIGLEWQQNKAMKINCTHTISDRSYEDAINPVN